MIKKIKIWTLNYASEIIQGKEKKICDLILDNLKRHQIPVEECVYGDRSIYNRFKYNLNSFVPHKLMYEVNDEYDEYFVPIPVKCLGRLYDENVDILKKIQNFYINNNQYEYDYFWDEGYKSDKYPKNKRARMCTKDKIGYYDILRNERDKGYYNILIGYSQGGLVARYLAWLDEYVFNYNAILGVITISSPNTGSPLANPENRENIINAIIEIILTLFSFYSNDYPQLLNRLQEILNFDEIIKIIDSFIIGISREKKKSTLLSRMITMRKWLGGLHRIPNNALFDLNCNMIDYEYSVLSCVNNNLPKRIFSGSIISTQNSIQNLLNQSIPWLKIISFFKDSIYNRSIFENYQRIDTIINKKIMNEIINIKNIDIKSIMKLYKDGIPGISKSKYLHDFIIPSSYQMIKDDSVFFSGNFFNKNADHFSGKSRKYPGGRDNYKYIKKILTIGLNTMCEKNNN